MRHCEKKAVTVNPTNRCNLRCLYCMASAEKEQQHPLDIDMEFARTGIRDALRGFPTGIPAQALRFFSPGEATQNMACLRECTAYAKSLMPEITVELQTNGLFEQAEDLQWIGEEVDVIWFSLDGPAVFNGKNRPDARGKDRTVEIEYNLRQIGERKKAFVGIRATITEDTLHRQEELVEYYGQLGITYLFVNPVISQIRREESLPENDKVTRLEVLEFAKEFIKGYKIARDLGIFYGNSLTFNFDEKTSVACRSCLPMPQLNPDGSVSSCDMAMYHNAPQELQCFLYGTWDPAGKKIAYDGEKISYLQRRNLANLAACSSCSIKEYCAGGCAGRTCFETGSIFQPIQEYCAATRYLAGQMELGRQIMHYTHP